MSSGSTSVPKTLPLDSDKFLPPASCKHKAKDEAALKDEAADRERMVCAIGIDVHYELNVMANEAGAYQPRAKVFNPRMSGPACPYNYTGRFVPEREHQRHADDPVVLGRTIEKAEPYDRDLYAKRDPRLVSKTVVIRDYGCKIPIDLADTEKIAKAVLNYYPDQYVDFLSDFVSNLFGDSMRKYLEVQQAGLQKLIDQPDELNRVSWGAYMAVQGGVDPNKSAPNAPANSNQFYEQQLQGDCTLRWSDDIANALGGLTKDGRAMTGQCTSQDVYDLRPCLQQHIQTLERMRTLFCRGFGSKEMHVLAMLWYANEQGRKMCHDLQLMAESDTPQYEKVTMQVPTNFFHLDEKDIHQTEALEPDLNSSIRTSLEEARRAVQWTHTLHYPVGAWSGNAESINVFLKTSSPSPFQWGWGHAANVAMRWTGHVTDPAGTDPRNATSQYQRLFVAPHLMYSYDHQNAAVRIDQSGAKVGRAYVKAERWGPSLRQPLDRSQLTQALAPGVETRKGSLRDSLDEPADTHFYRGVGVGDHELMYQGVNTSTVQGPAGTETTFFTPAPKERPPMQITASTACPDPYGVQVINPRICRTGCESLDPFVSVGGRCIAMKDGKAAFKFSAVGPYDIAAMTRTALFTNFLRRPKDGLVLLHGGSSGPAAAKMQDASRVYDALKQKAIQAFYHHKWALYLDKDYKKEMVELRKNTEVKEPSDVASAKMDLKNAQKELDKSVWERLPDVARLAGRRMPTDFDRNALPASGPFIDKLVSFADIQQCLTPFAAAQLDKAGFYGLSGAVGKFLDDATSWTAKYGELQTILLNAVHATHWTDRMDHYNDDMYTSGTLPSLRSPNFAAAKQELKRKMVTELLRNMTMRWWDGASSLNGKMDLVHSSLFLLVVKLSDPESEVIHATETLLPSYSAGQLGTQWPVRTMITGNKSDCGIGLPFVSHAEQFQTWRKGLPGNVLDMSRFTVKADADLTLSMSNLTSDDDADKVAMQIVTLRLVLQSSMGMFVGALLCHNPFDMDVYCDTTQLVFPDLNTPIPYRDTGEQVAYEWSNLWERNGWKECFGYDGKSKKLVMYESTTVKRQDADGRYVMDPKDARGVVLRRVRGAIVDRVKLMMSDNKEGKQRLATRLAIQVAPYATFGSFDAESPTWSTLHAMGLDDIPSDLLFQNGECGILDPLLLYASTASCYKKQWDSVPSECNDFLLALKMTRSACEAKGTRTRTDGRLRELEYFEFLWEDRQHMTSRSDPWTRKAYDLDEIAWFEEMARDQKARGQPMVRPHYDAATSILPPYGWDASAGGPGALSWKASLDAVEHLDKIHPSAIKSNMAHWWSWILSSFDDNKSAIATLLGDLEPTFRGATYRAAGSSTAPLPPRAPIPNNLSAQNQIASILGRDSMDANTLYQPIPTAQRASVADKTPEFVSKIKYGTDEKYYPVGPFEEVRPLNNADGAGRFVRAPVLHGETHPEGDTKQPTDDQRLVVLPVSGADYDRFKDPIHNGMAYNYNLFRPQFFSVLDAAGLLWHAREFVNPADSNRPKDYEDGQPSDMHPWCTGLCETFVRAREVFLRDHKDKLWEVEVKKNPGMALPTETIGQMCDESWSRYFPLLPANHELRKELAKIRALDYMWGTLPAYHGGSFSVHNSGAWMPLSMAHQVRLLDSVGLFDHKYHVPRNPWLAHGGEGISRVFNQSYHSVYYNDSYRASHFREWLKQACRYQKPNKGCFYPFSQYGGTPVEADFVHHRVEKPERQVEARHKQLMYNRFGFHAALRLGQQFHDTGLLQDLYSFKYRQFADLSVEQRAMPEATALYPSNFLAYARNHAIIALASCNHGTEEASVPRTVRNLYRLYVDTYECMGANPDDDGVPAIMGFLATPIKTKEDRPVVLYAGSLACLNTKLERFCSSPANKGEKVCQMFKQVYLNDATLLFTRLLRAERRKILHENNYRRALIKRQGNYTPDQFRQDLIELQDAYIEFLQTTVLGMLLESGADLNNAPLHLLEPRELEVSMLEEDDNVVGNDYLTPRTAEILKGMDFSGDNLTRTQLAILSLIPPNHRILGTLRLNQSTEIVDLEHAKKQIQKETIDSNKKVWQRYSEALIGAAFGQKLLEVEGPIDFGYDLTAVKDPLDVRFKMSDFKDPLRESEKIKSKFTTTHAQSSSSLSQSVRGEAMRSDRGPESVLGMNTAELSRALQAVRDRVERDFDKQGGHMSRAKCLAMLRIPEHIKRMLRSEYE